MPIRPIIATLVVALFLATARAQVSPPQFTFDSGPTLDASSGLVLNGTASHAAASGELLLNNDCTASTSSCTPAPGSFYLPTSQRIEGGFEMSFTFSLTADWSPGFAFLIHDRLEGTSHLGSNKFGYDEPYNGFAVRFFWRGQFVQFPMPAMAALGVDVIRYRNGQAKNVGIGYASFEPAPLGTAPRTCRIISRPGTPPSFRVEVNGELLLARALDIVQGGNGCGIDYVADSGGVPHPPPTTQPPNEHLTITSTFTGDTWVGFTGTPFGTSDGFASFPIHQGPIRFQNINWRSWTASRGTIPDPSGPGTLDSLLVNASSGGASRTVHVDAHAPWAITLDNSPSDVVGSPFILWGAFPSAPAIPYPTHLGSLAFRPPPVGSLDDTFVLAGGLNGDSGFLPGSTTPWNQTLSPLGLDASLRIQGITFDVPFAASSVEITNEVEVEFLTSPPTLPPAVATLSPPRPDLGDLVTMTGFNFESGMTGSLDGTSVAITVIDANTAEFTSPIDVMCGASPVDLVLANGSATSSPVTLNPLPQPVIVNAIVNGAIGQLLVFGIGLDIAGLQFEIDGQTVTPLTALGAFHSFALPAASSGSTGTFTITTSCPPAPTVTFTYP